MKINGIEVKGLKKAVGDFRRYANTTIIYDFKTRTVSCVGENGLEKHIDEMDNGHYRYVNLILMLDDIFYNNDYEVSMSTLYWLLQAYVI